jgi:hypothetical protein
MAHIKMTQKQFNRMQANNKKAAKHTTPKAVKQYAAPIGPKESRVRRVNRAVEGGATQFITSVGEWNRAVAPHVRQSKGDAEPKGGRRGSAPSINLNTGSGFVGAGFDYGRTQAHGSALHNMGGEWLGLGDSIGMGGNYLDFGSELLPVAKRRR